MLLITGNFVDDGTSKEDMVAASKALGKLELPYGVYFVHGNHDNGYYEEKKGLMLQIQRKNQLRMMLKF